MRKETAEALRALNRRFYRERAAEFSRARERPWSGWGEILARAGALLPGHPRVLDVGCGNGRFARFLEERLGTPFDYCGVDESPLALAEARKRLADRERMVFIEGDFLRASLPERGFDLIALFGLLHHVPGRSNRIDLLTRLSALLAPGGLLAFSVWRFDRWERFQRKIVAWEQLLSRTGIEIDLSDLEPGDRILTWGGTPPAFRFCHQMSDEEEGDLAARLPLELVAWFDAGAEPNRYYVFRYPQTARRALAVDPVVALRAE